MNSYKIACTYGNDVLKKDMLEKLYYFGRSYVYSVMWETYPTIMRNPLHRDDVIDEIWCVIFEQIDNYDCSKSSLYNILVLSMDQTRGYGILFPKFS